MSEKTKITFFGHSMFLIGSTKGLKIGTDPYDENVKSILPKTSADIVLSSHSHFDHNNFNLFHGDHVDIKTTGKFDIHEINIEGYLSFHDNLKGSLRGKNIIYKFTVDKMVFIHFGDLGEMLKESMIKEFYEPDIIFIPIGGTYTIDYIKALSLIKELSPKIVVPMHFKEKDTKISVCGIDVFKKEAEKTYQLKEFKESFEINKETLPAKTEIWIISS